MALLLALPTPMPQKTMAAVTENNYSFRRSLTAGEVVYLHTTNHCCYTSRLPRQPNPEQAAPQIHPPPSPPLPEIAWPCPLSHTAPKLSFDYTDEKL